MENLRFFVVMVAQLIAVPTFANLSFRGKPVTLDYRFIPAYNGDHEETVMLHIPGSMSPWNWAMMVPFWCSYILGYASVVASPPGEGWSSKANRMFYEANDAIQNLARLYLEFLLKLGFTKVILVSHSTNATQVVTEMAILAHEYEITVEGIVLQAPSGLKRMWNPLGLLVRFSLSGSLLRWINGKEPGLIAYFEQFFTQPLVAPVEKPIFSFQAHWQKLRRAGGHPLICAVKAVIAQANHYLDLLDISFEHVEKMWFELRNAGDGKFPDRLKLVPCKVFVLFPQHDFVHPFRSPLGKNRIDIVRECIPEGRLFVSKLKGKLHNPTLLGSDPIEVALVLRKLFQRANLRC